MLDLPLPVVLPLVIMAVAMLACFVALRRALGPLAEVRRMLRGGASEDAAAAFGGVLADRDGNSVPDILEHVRLADAAPPRDASPPAAREVPPRRTIPLPIQVMKPAETLEELQRLYDRRLITREEYEAKKREVLARM